MYAIIETGGKQYQVKEGDEISTLKASSQSTRLSWLVRTTAQ